MSRGEGEIAASTLPVRPQQRNQPPLAHRRQKDHPQMMRQPPTETPKTPLLCKITIERASFPEYYPCNNPGKFR